MKRSPSGDQVSIRSVRAASGSETVPQVFVNGERIGDSEALQQWLASRKREAA